MSQHTTVPPREPMKLGRVLLVEDESDQAQLLKRWIEHDLGLEVDVAADGAAAKSKVEDPSYDVIVTDVGLPKHDGLSVLERSKQLFPERPAMVVTAFDGRAVLLKALRGHADDFLSKPLSRDFAIKRIRRLSEHAKERTSRMKSALGQKSVLAISAHPDDVEIGCGGALLKHRTQGDRVTIVVLTDGSRGGEKDQRIHEARRSAERLGADIRFLNLPDGSLSSDPETIVPLEEVITSVSPDVVYTHSPHDTHQDHRAAFFATRVAARKIPSFFCYQSPSATVDFKPTKFVDIEHVLEEKLSLLNLFSSQKGIRSYLSAEAVRSTSTYWGRFTGFRPAEPLEVIREHA